MAKRRTNADIDREIAALRKQQGPGGRDPREREVAAVLIGGVG
jgi:hypothetical protein